MEGNIAATYSLIYCFLKQQSQNKAAEAVKKAAKPFVDLRDDIEQKGPPLEDIIKEWKTKENIKPDTNPSSEDSESSDSSSSDPEDNASNSDSRWVVQRVSVHVQGVRSKEPEDTSGSESEGDDASDSDDSSDDLDDGATSNLKISPKKPAERDTSVTLSSVGEPTQEAAHQVTQTAKKSTKDVDKATKDNSKSSESDSSDSDSSDLDSSSEGSASGSSDAELSSGSSDSSDEEENTNLQSTTDTPKFTKAKSQSTSESSSESDDESNSEPRQKEDTCMGGKGKFPEKVTTAVAESTSESSSESGDETDSESDEDMHVVKKRKVAASGAAVTIPAATTSQQIDAGASQKKENPPPKAKERFQRVKVQNVAFDMLDNGYKARGGATNDYGERAHRDLIVTRGAGFRKEKNKKKRGSYRGGEITMESHSIKFDF